MRGLSQKPGEEAYPRTLLSDMVAARLELYLRDVYQRLIAQGISASEMETIKAEHARLVFLYQKQGADLESKQAIFAHISDWYQGVKTEIEQKVRQAIKRYGLKRVVEAFAKIHEINRQLNKPMENEEDEEDENFFTVLRRRIGMGKKPAVARNTLLDEQVCESSITGNVEREYNIHVTIVARPPHADFHFEFLCGTTARESFETMQRLEREIYSLRVSRDLLKEKLDCMERFFEAMRVLVSTRRP